MRLSNLADYAVVLMSAAARHCGQARVSATELARETGLPLPTAQKLVSLLVRGGLLRTARGAGGGVQLSRPPAAITLADIVEAIEGPIALTACCDGEAADRPACEREPDCEVRPHWRNVNVAVRGALVGVSLASVAGRTRT